MKRRKKKGRKEIKLQRLSKNPTGTSIQMTSVPPFSIGGRLCSKESEGKIGIYCFDCKKKEREIGTGELLCFSICVVGFGRLKKRKQKKIFRLKNKNKKRKKKTKEESSAVQ